jgi:hypothetical protein
MDRFSVTAFFNPSCPASRDVNTGAHAPDSAGGVGESEATTRNPTRGPALQLVERQAATVSARMSIPASVSA